MKGSEIRQKFLDFFAKNGHTMVPSSSLLPDDPSVLLTTAGMQQFKPYYTGAADAMRDFQALNTTSSQKCFRTSDIDEVGDDTHLTFFEMLGNFSFGGYLKEGAIRLAHEFITRELDLKISYVTIFEGSHGVPKDDESRAVWQSLDIKDIREEGINDVFWGPTGASGPCGPTTEIYCTNANGKDVEVWNLVFNQFFYAGSREELLAQTPGKALEPLKTPGVDTGMGLERLVMIAQKKRNLFETDLFAPFVELVPHELDERVRRVIVDHIRGSAFLIADGVRPSNKEVGYVLRRLLRRVFAFEELYKMPVHIIDALLHDIVHEYGETYKDLGAKADTVRAEVTAERERFMRTLKSGIKEINNLPTIDAIVAFNLYQSFGISYEIIKDVAKEKAASLVREDFEAELQKHQEKSRQGAEKKFGGHGLMFDTGELKAKDATELQKVTRLHSATHLLQASLRKVLGADVHQMGSDITVERTRFDFAFGRKMTQDELKAVEDLINSAIEKDYTVTKKLLPFDDAVKTGALYFFKEKYPETVNVYTFGTPDESEVFSREFCGGPHVTHTREIGKFRILKEEASSAGVRRIRATIEP
ncbi:MAG: alanine--tRNA ligase [Candidatus Ryanbacteria bacterium]|nr:alanine--tRNA ligase [Candidatus Ryanbacteria bacterium]